MRIAKPRKIYAHKGHSLTNGTYRLKKDEDMRLTKLMQIPRIYKYIDRFGGGTVYGFTSLVKRPDGWYLNRPYYIYSGDKPHTYRRLPKIMQYKINAIYLIGYLKDFNRKIVDKISYRYDVWRHKTKSRTKYICAYFSEDNRMIRRNNKAWDNMFNGHQ